EFISDRNSFISDRNALFAPSTLTPILSSRRAISARMFRNSSSTRFSGSLFTPISIRPHEIALFLLGCRVNLHFEGASSSVPSLIGSHRAAPSARRTTGLRIPTGERAPHGLTVKAQFAPPPPS